MLPPQASQLMLSKHLQGMQLTKAKFDYVTPACLAKRELSSQLLNNGLAWPNVYLAAWTGDLILALEMENRRLRQMNDILLDQLARLAQQHNGWCNV